MPDVAHTYNTNTQEAKAGKLSHKFKTTIDTQQDIIFTEVIQNLKGTIK